MDEIDLHILRELQRDSSRTNLALARAVGLSAPACLRRVRKLREEGVIRGEIAVLDPRRLGGMTVVIEVNLVSARRDVVKEFERRMQAEAAVAQCLHVTGQHDFLLLLRVPGVDAFEAFAARALNGDACVLRYESEIVLDEVKRDLSLPI